MKGVVITSQLRGAIVEIFLRKTETSGSCGLTGQADLVQIFTPPLMWRVALLAVLPLIVWFITDGRYRYDEERAGGINFIIKVDRLNPEHVCLIMDIKNISAGLKESLCKE